MMGRQDRDQGLDKAFETSTEPDHVKDKRRRALTDQPPGTKKNTK
jgi:hypothetical protein